MEIRFTPYDSGVFLVTETKFLDPEFWGSLILSALKRGTTRRQRKLDQYFAASRKVTVRHSEGPPLRRSWHYFLTVRHSEHSDYPGLGLGLGLGLG